MKFWWQDERNCKQCGDPFEPKQKNQMYCKRKCRGRYYRLHPEEIIKDGDVYNRTCPECGDPFETIKNQQIYCCDTCRYDVNSRRKYHHDKKYSPDVHERNKKRRAKNRKRWGEQKLKDGLCNRCGKNPISTTTLCGDCYEYIKSREVRA